jgi:hypothetical protein
MADIYSNTVLNISAHASSKAHQGIFAGANSKKLESPLNCWSNRPTLKHLALRSLNHGVAVNAYAKVCNSEVPTDVASVLQQRA